MMDDQLLSKVRRAGRFCQGGTALLWCIGFAAAFASVASGIIWGMHLMTADVPVPLYARPVQTDAFTPATRVVATAPLLFEQPAAAKSAEIALDGLRLHGVVADRRGVSVALVSIDGAAPLRFRAMSPVRDGLVISEIHPRHVVLQQSGKTATLNLVERQSLAPAGAVVSAVPAVVNAFPAAPAQAPVQAPLAPMAQPK